MEKAEYEPYRPPPHKTKAFRVLSEAELKTLETICVFQCTYADICHAFSMSKATLVRMRKDDPRVLRAMNKGYSRGRLKLRKAIFKKAQTGDDRVMMFLAKKILGFSDWRPKVKQRKVEEDWSEMDYTGVPEPFVDPATLIDPEWKREWEEYERFWASGRKEATGPASEKAKVDDVCPEGQR